MPDTLKKIKWRNRNRKLLRRMSRIKMEILLFEEELTDGVYDGYNDKSELDRLMGMMDVLYEKFDEVWKNQVV